MDRARTEWEESCIKGGIATWVLTCQNQNGVVIDRGNQANLRAAAKTAGRRSLDENGK